MSVPPLVLTTEHSPDTPSKGILKRRPAAPTTLQRSSSWLATLNSRLGSAIHGTTESPPALGIVESKEVGYPGKLVRSQTVGSVPFQVSKLPVAPKLALEGAELKRVRFSVVQLTQVQFYDCQQDDLGNGIEEINRSSTAKADNNIPKINQRYSSLPKLYQIPLSPTDSRMQHVVPAPNTSQNLLEIYHTSCRAREESVLPIVQAILESKKRPQDLKQMNLSRNSISHFASEPLSDILSLDTGLLFLDLSHCDLTDAPLKIILHSLLVNDKLRSLALAGNKKLTSAGYTYISIYISKSRSIKYLDLSSNTIDKKSANSLSESLMLATSLQTLMLDSCYLSPAILDIFSDAIRTSVSLHEVSLRGNEFNKKAFPPLCSMLEIPLAPKELLDCSGLVTLNLSGNDLRHGIRLLSKTLTQNNQLQTLNLQNCHLDSSALVPLAEALKSNTALKKIDLSHNPLNTPHQDGVYALKLALFMNRSLTDISMAKCNLHSEDAIAIAECLPENNVLSRLDLSGNPAIGIAGLLALSVSVKMSTALTFLDIAIPLNDPDMAHLQNDIVSACTRNAQAMYDSVGKESQNSLTAGNSCDTRASTPSMEQVTASVQVKEANNTQESEAQEPSLDMLINNINSCAHDLTATIDQYHASGKEIVDDNLHKLYVQCQDIQSVLLKHLIQDDDETESLAEAATHLNEAMKSYHQFVATSKINKSSQAGVDAELAKQIQMEKLKREKQIEEGEAFRTG
ncbi:hypothetical protein K450DRAFT_250124 [Umbelopsis ramanniana AG]|uniref:Uncharacterized protein n=1 Tax=Umbelopsis ramanniana AG TaxID=1314678 RepID=A0AAD5HCF0_UMBRA|nr:uncharacterized protein K450DRAFT_250124 [Umbelopsis ramanniana AG]KAI8577814.1 hypothetical protein K450DRAFT_250124 [Umbelopsis ramanniana AG]